jgi:hypothetical protein
VDAHHGFANHAGNLRRTLHGVGVLVMEWQDRLIIAMALVLAVCIIALYMTKDLK